jgi:hypothetical protein
MAMVDATGKQKESAEGPEDDECNEQSLPRLRHGETGPVREYGDHQAEFKATGLRKDLPNVSKSFGLME